MTLKKVKTSVAYDVDFLPEEFNSSKRGPQRQVCPR